MKNVVEEATFCGVYAAALTPMNDDLSCNHEALASHCKDVMSRGCSGVILFGTTGEGSSFTVKERQDAIKAVIALGVPPQKIVVAISCCAINDAVQIASTAMDQHCSAVLIVPPFFYKKGVEDAGVIAFYREVIQRVGRPELKLFLYHIPQYSGVPITLHCIKTLREEFPNTVIGIKDSDGNFPFTREVLSLFPGFKVFVGNELHISEAVQLGAAGGMSGIANAYPELICSLFEYGKNKQKPNNNEMAQSIGQLIRRYSIYPAIKCIVEQQKGSSWHVVRPPLVPLTEQQSQALINEICFSTE